MGTLIKRWSHQFQVLKEVEVPVIPDGVCENNLRRTRLGPGFALHEGFLCAGGEEGKDACKVTSLLE